MEKEIWKKIDWSPDYEISSYGRVKSYRIDKDNGKILKTHKNYKGYITIQLPDLKLGTIRHTGIHKLVAEAFIPNPENKSDVNHIDEDKENNYYKNLEWLTHKENLNHGKRNKKYSKRVECIELGKIFNSLAEAKRETGANNIHAVCKGRIKTSGGFHWRYID